MTVFAHIAPHPDVLVLELCDRLRTAPPDPFTPELIAVPTRGIERWLTQRIALELSDVAGGIAANIEFPSPHRLVRSVALQFRQLAASIEAWEEVSLQSVVMTAIDENLAEPWMALIRRHLDVEGSSRLSAAAKVAGLFSTYLRRRPAMIASWAGGSDIDPAGEPLAERHVWQPRLWRSVRDRLGVPSLAELGPAALDPIKDGIPEFPQRMSVYGLTTADPFDLDVLVAVGETRDVHLHLLHPSPGLWSAVAKGAVLAGTDRSTDRTHALVDQPLLKAWGRDSRELQLVLARHGVSGDPTAVTDGGTSLLARLQADIRLNRQPTPEPSDRSDDSIQIHVCHGARRQVEVLRDAILHILSGDPTLEPRDVVIMTPDLATFAPLLEAGFPHEQTGGMPDLRVRIADRSPSATNPLVRFTAGILDVVDGRLEAGVVRDLVTLPMVQQQFGFDSDTAESIVSVIDDANIAWGLDAHDRTEWGLGGVTDRTWRRGLDRALAGVFYTDSPVRVVGGVAPLDGIEGQDARPVGILAAIIDRLSSIHALLADPRPMSEWAGTVATAVRMLAAVGWDDEWQWGRLERLLADTFAPGPVDPTVSLVEARRAMSAWTDDRPSPLHFRTGDVTVCTLAPMRSVPYRVVCLLGMDDERFPRRGRSDGDDLLRGHELIGDHDRSGEDRQLLLDAVMAAGDHLVITYSGRDEITNAEYPPAVPISELTDVLATMSQRSRADMETRHPLQSFSEAVFTPGALRTRGIWGFDRRQLDGALALQRREEAAAPQPIIWPQIEAAEVIRLEDLVRFLANPVAGFVRASLGFRIPSVAEPTEDGLPVKLDPLAVWAVKDRMIDGLARGHTVEDLISRGRAADWFPPAALASPTIESARTDVEALWAAAGERGYHRGRHRRFRGGEMIGGRLVEGSVNADPELSHLPLVTPSRINPTHRLRAFTELAFLSLVEPDRRWHAMLLGRRPRGPGLVEVMVGPLGETAAERVGEARRLLAGLVALYEDGQSRPLALPCATGYAWQSNARNRDAAFVAAVARFEEDRFSPEAKDASHKLVFPDVTTFEALLEWGFEDDCQRLWEPIIAVMKDQKV